MIFGSSPTELSVGELAAHKPSFKYGGMPLVMRSSISDTSAGLENGGLWVNESKTINDKFNYIGNDECHNNLTPCITTYIWHRLS